MLNRSFLRQGNARERGVTTGFTIDQEGLAMVSVMQSGVETVKPSAGTSGEVFVGFSLTTTVQPSTKTWVETGTIPAATTYTIQLKNTNLVTTPATQIIIKNLTAGTTMTLNAGVASGQYNVNTTTGLVTFNVAQAGNSVEITYKTNLTVAQSKLLFQQGLITNTAAADYNQVGVIYGASEVYTDQFDVAQDWAVAASVTLGASGQLTVGGTGTVIGRVISVPSATNGGWLGVAVNVA